MKETIKTNVIAYIASFANRKSSALEDEYVLKEDPLNMDDTKLGFLALALRAYLKSIKPAATVLASEIRKKDLTVKGTYELIIQKSGV